MDFTSCAAVISVTDLPLGATSVTAYSVQTDCANAPGSVRTTNSHHNYFIYGDLLNTTPRLKATRFGQLCVVDITYVATDNGWAYLSLVTDAATRMIVGWALHPTLAREGPMEAMNAALRFYRKYGFDFSNMIQHSDRGVQY